MKKIKISELDFDTAVYPRKQMNQDHIHRMTLALQLGVNFPPVVACERSKKVVDGFHRCKAFQKAGIEEIDVVFKHYETIQELFLDAVRLNASHGKRLSNSDQKRCRQIASKLQVNEKDIASSLVVSVDYVRQLTVDHSIRDSAVTVPKRRHEESEEELEELNGNLRVAMAKEIVGNESPLACVNKVVHLIEAGQIDEFDEGLINRLIYLKELIHREIRTKAKWI